MYKCTFRFNYLNNLNYYYMYVTFTICEAFDCVCLLSFIIYCNKWPILLLIGCYCWCGKGRQVYKWFMPIKHLYMLPCGYVYDAHSRDFRVFIASQLHLSWLHMRILVSIFLNKVDFEFPAPSPPQMPCLLVILFMMPIFFPNLVQVCKCFGLLFFLIPMCHVY